MPGDLFVGHCFFLPSRLQLYGTMLQRAFMLIDNPTQNRVWYSSVKHTTPVEL